LTDVAKTRNAESVLEALPCGVVSFEDNGTIASVNTTLASMLGYDSSELAGKSVEALLGIAGRIFLQTHLFPILRLHGRAEEIFLLWRHKSGSEVGALINAWRREIDGQAITDCVVMEVRERRKYEDALLRAKQTADAANATAQQRTAQLELANKKLEEQADALELHQQQLQDQATELEMQSEQLLTANEELTARSHDLEQARAVADEANRAKSQFLAVMSHELRTPLNAIGGYTQLLDLGIHGPITPAQREALDRIMHGQRHLLRLINDVLNLARIEAGRVDYAIEEVPIADLVATVMPMIEPQIAAGGLTSITSVGPALVALADREKMQQILINLLTNAVKFTPSGGTVRLFADRDDQTRQIRVSVADSGIGIPADKLKSVFEPFVQVDVGPTRRKEGSGLGLAISRDLARGMRGDVTATSEAGSGSTFTLVLPSA
jgi:PAS domain S-box-containing protein